MTSHDDIATTTKTPHEPSKWWLAVWITIAFAGGASWVYLYMEAKRRDGQTTDFGDSVLINFFSLWPVIGVIAVCTWVVRYAQHRIAVHADEQADRRHCELIDRLDKIQAEDSQRRRWQAIADDLRRTDQEGGGTVVNLRR